MRYFDTHAHIGLIHEDPIEQLIIAKEAKQVGINHIISICNNINDFFVVHKNLEMAPHVYHAVGISPSEVETPGRDWEQLVHKGIQMERVAAIGEIGLDYYRKFGNKNSQIELFIRQLEMAEQLDKPVIIHNREAGKDVLEILRDKNPPRGAILHCYSEDWEYAKNALDLNVYISFAGNVTYRNARNLHDTALNMPLDRMLVESEAPFMVPAAYRGKRNRPTYLRSTVNFLSELCDIDEEELSEILYDNACRFFGIDE